MDLTRELHSVSVNGLVYPSTYNGRTKDISKFQRWGSCLNKQEVEFLPKISSVVGESAGSSIVDNRNSNFLLSESSNLVNRYNTLLHNVLRFTVEIFIYIVFIVIVIESNP